MGIALGVFGALLFVFGAVDLIGSFTGLDVWGQWIGANIPEPIWTYTAWIEMGLGGFLAKLGFAD